MANTVHDLLRQAGEQITARRAALIEPIVARHYERSPDLADRYGSAGREYCRKDTEYHLTYLAEALAAATPALFAEYIAWAKVMLAGRRIPSEDLATHLECVREVLQAALPPELAGVTSDYLAAGLDRLPQLPASLPPFLDEVEPLGRVAGQYLAALLQGERSTATQLVNDALDAGASLEELYHGVFARSQQELGRRWQMNQISVAQEHYCTAATQLLMAQLAPRFLHSPKQGRVLVAACVAGELHEVGLRMVTDLFEMNGWDTHYLGASTPTPGLLQMLADRKADVLALSATMTWQVRELAELIGRVRAAPVGPRVKILVGGHLFQVAPHLAQQLGADGTAADARAALQLADQLLSPGGK
jgi:methanogenic corrinoid protein MtbC1